MPWLSTAHDTIVVRDRRTGRISHAAPSLVELQPSLEALSFTRLPGDDRYGLLHGADLTGELHLMGEAWRGPIFSYRIASEDRFAHVELRHPQTGLFLGAAPPSEAGTGDLEFGAEARLHATR